MAIAGYSEYIEGTTPATPSTGNWRAYFKSDGLYVLDDAGTETKIVSPTTLDLTSLTTDALILDDGSELTIATGAITVTTARHTVDTEGDAATDDLDTINGLAEREICIITANNAARTVVVKNGTGNISCAGDFDISLDDAIKAVLLIGTASGVNAYPLFERPTQAIQTATTTVANTVTETTLYGTIGRGTLTIAANTLAVGDTLKLSARGIMSETGTPNINFRVKFGSTEIVSTGNITMSGAMTNDSWILDCEITVLSIGASGTVFGAGAVFLDDTSNVNGLTNSSTPATAIVVDTTAAITINITAQWDTADAGNTITTQVANVRLLR